MNNIKYPTLKHKNYVECIFQYCCRNRFSLVLKGSLSKGTASEFSDIDLIILGNVTDLKINEIVELYDKPVMVNLTENPKGILILVYKDNISVDLDVRETVSEEELSNSIILLKYAGSFLISDKIKRADFKLKCLQNRQEYHKTLRLIHRGLVKHLSNKSEIAIEFLAEVKESMDILGFRDLKYNNSFKDDMKQAFMKITERYNVDDSIIKLFENLFCIL